MCIRDRPELVAFARVIINFLQDVQILISPAAAAFRRVIGTDDVLVRVIDVFLLVPVSVFVVGGGRGIHHTGGGLPVFVTVGQAEKLVERAERPHSGLLYTSFVAIRCAYLYCRRNDSVSKSNGGHPQLLP